jgi:tetratricopeptide (TPR) repeat protein
MAGKRSMTAEAAQRPLLGQAGQIVSGIALLAFSGAVGAAAAETAPVVAKPDLAAWSHALHRSAGAPLLTASGASAALGLALLIAPALSNPRRRTPVRLVKEGVVHQPLDLESAARRVAQRLTDGLPADALEGAAAELARRLTGLFLASETDKRAAAALLETGDDAAAAARLEALVRRQDEVFGPRSRLAGRTWRELAVLRLADNPAQALEAYRRAGRRDPNDFRGQLFCARLAARAGYCRIACRAAQDAVRTAVGERDRITALTVYGDAAKIAGELIQARGAYESALAISRQLAARDHRDLQWLRDLLSGYHRLGDVEDAARNPSRALGHYRQSLPLAAALIEREPHNLRWRLDYEVTRRRIAELQAQMAGAI